MDSSPSENTSIYSSLLKCQICGDQSSGLHYGVYSCEGCKGFFRRTQRLGLQYKVCPFWDTVPCDINIKNRNKCRYCRYKKCISLGMCAAAVRMGRVPTAEKVKIIKEIDVVDKNKSSLEMEHDGFVQDIYDAYKETLAEIQEDEIVCFRTYCAPYVDDPGDIGLKNSDPKNALPREITTLQGIIKHNSSLTEIFVQKAAKFAKKLDVFRSLELKDQMTLFKEAVLEIVSVKHAHRYEGGIVRFPENNTYFRDVTCVRHSLMKFGDLDTPQYRFKFSRRVNTIGINDKEMAILCALIIASPDREGLVEYDKIEEFQRKLSEALEKEVKKNPSPDVNRFAKIVAVLMELRGLIPTHIRTIKAIRDMHNGKLPIEPTPLMKEVLRLDSEQS